jgi:hypothetical protein
MFTDWTHAGVLRGPGYFRRACMIDFITQNSWILPAALVVVLLLADQIHQRFG